MAEENKHMDDAFKRMSEEFKVSYNPAFWEEAATKLDDAMLDDAFKAAAASVVDGPSFEPTESVDDLFMDSAFVDAASNSEATYDPAFFEQFMANEGDLAMDEAFVEAAGASVANYLPEYWTDADKALRNEGLHYEYSSQYWQEAKALLDRQDRRVFFARWSAVAAILLLLSFTGAILNPAPIEVNGMMANEADLPTVESDFTTYANNLMAEAHETLMADKELAVYTDLADEADQNVNGLDNNNNDLADNNGNNDQLNNNDGNGSNDLANNDVNGNQLDQNNGLNNDNNGFASTDESNKVIKTNLDEFESIKINTGLADLTKNEDAMTFTNIGNMSKTPIRHIGYARPIPEIEIRKPDPTNIHTIGILAETGIGNRWGDFSYLPTMRNSFGIEYLMTSGKRFPNFEFGGNFKINHIRQTQLGAEERSSVYDVHGNVEKYFRMVQLKDMVFTNLNGVVNYRIAPVHKLKFGVGVEYLTALRSNMSYKDEFTSEITTVNNNWGVKEGINKFDLRLSIGYEFEISNRFTLQFNSSMGMFDRTDNVFMKNVQTDREINLMMGLKYNFVKLER